MDKLGTGEGLTELELGLKRIKKSELNYKEIKTLILSNLPEILAFN